MDDKEIRDAWHAEHGWYPEERPPIVWARVALANKHVMREMQRRLEEMEQRVRALGEQTNEQEG